MTYKQPITVLLDNGHGKDTMGKMSPEWEHGTLYEWEYARKLVCAIQLELIRDLIPSIKITPEMYDVSLSERANRVNVLCKTQRCILISVHLNAGGGTGWEVWTTKGTTNSDKLAAVFCEEFDKMFPDKKNRGAKEENFTILYKSNCPCVLTENFFMDNKSDYLFLNDEENFKKIVTFHVNAIKTYIERYQ